MDDAIVDTPDGARPLVDSAKRDCVPGTRDNVDEDDMSRAEQCRADEAGVLRWTLLLRSSRHATNNSAEDCRLG